MRRTVIETRVDNPTVIAAALRPDHTDDMTTRVADGTVRTEISRPTTASLHATTDDYVVNLSVATRVETIADAHATTESDTTDHPTTDNQ